jgi:hypothetical protein
MTEHQLHTLDRLSVQGEYPLLAAEREAIRAALAERERHLKALDAASRALAVSPKTIASHALELVNRAIFEANGGQP